MGTNPDLTALLADADEWLGTDHGHLPGRGFIVKLAAALREARAIHTDDLRRLTDMHNRHRTDMEKAWRAGAKYGHDFYKRGGILLRKDETVPELKERFMQRDLARLLGRVDREE